MILTTNNMTVKTDAQLKAELDTTFYTNGANLSTGALTNTHLTNAIESKVSVIDAETINGVKTFGSFPVTPSSAPTTDYQVANKKYVDDNEVDGLWEVDGTETQLIIADAIDMQTMPIINMDDPTADQDAATKKYVDDSYEIYINKDVISLTAGQVATLGTVPVELISAPSANIFINVLNASIKITPSTTLDVGIQDLHIIYHGGQTLLKLGTSEIETVEEARWIFRIKITSDSNTEVLKETAIDLQLSGGTNPSGEAEMEVTIYYTLETY